MEPELQEAAVVIVDRAQSMLTQEHFTTRERNKWQWVIRELLEAGVIEIGTNLLTGPDHSRTARVTWRCQPGTRFS